MKVDLLDPEIYPGNPHETWTWMRTNEPVYRDEGNDLWALTRHADVLFAERHDELFSSRGCYRAYVAPQETNMIAQDDPRHAEQRRLVLGRFTPKAVREREPEIHALVEELLDAVAPSGKMEVVADLAAQLPSRLTCRLLGLPEQDWPTVKGWSERLMRIDSRRDSDATMGLMTAVIELLDRVKEEVPARRGCPMDALLDVWANSELDGQPLDEETILHETGLFVSGGAETTRTVISHGLRTFADHPEQWELLHEQPDLVPSAVEEVLRWATPLNNMFRTTTAEVEVGGSTLPAGARVMLVYPSANRDESVFDDPFRFDVTRSPNPHLAFGNGTHFCLGATLARHTLTILFGEMARRFTNLRVESEPDVEPNLFARAVRRFELGFDLRSR